MGSARPPGDAPLERTGAALLHRPIIGGVFGAGRYALATTTCVLHGLHAVRFMVVNPSTGGVLSIADSKRGALDEARLAIQLAAAPDKASEVAPQQGELWPIDVELPRPIVDRHRPVSKRRRVIFDKCGGKCHYCRRVLTLDGTWHIEHMLPKALGGADNELNLVAACAPCNLAKRDRTALEFLANHVQRR